ncbi:MAG: DNA methyltransferase, partial [bacterium]
MPRKKQNKKSIERYEHTDKRRVNNPPVGLVTPETDKELGKKTYAYDPHIDPALQFDSQRSKVERIIDDGLSAETLEQAKAALQELKKRQQPYLNWAGKAEGTTFEVPTVSLHVHERIDPRTIVEAVRKRNGDLAPQLSLFESPEENPPLRQAIEFYQHKHNWSNRLIAGDSLLLMNSLLEKEGLAGQVQMIYIDPPYGIKYGSNFQPFVNKRDVRHGKDEDLTAEPEMIKAFRDTWELGIHSYLTYLRDRLLLARELLADSGSVFVQISDENVQHVRELLDEVFGTSNFVGQISVKKSGMMVGGLFKSACYYLVWYAWEIEKVKFRKLFVDKEAGIGIGKLYDQIESPDSMSQRKMTLEEISNPDLIPKGWRPYQLITLTTGGFRENTTIEYEFEGKTYHPGPDKCWRTTREGLDRLQSLGRLQARGQLLYYKTYLADFPAAEVTSLWSDIGSQGEKMVYAVQTPRRLIGRAILMTTDPGDLVFDPTCG